MRNKIDLTGQRFGRLVVVEEVEPYATPKGQKHRRYKCKCDCGSEKNIVQTSLRGGQTKSCGCLNGELVANRRKKDYTGERFGRLTAIRDTGKRKSNAIWLFSCECGEEIEIKANNVFSGNTKSCGCADKPEIGTKLSLIDPERKLNSNNTSGTTGVYRINNASKWGAELTIKDHTVYLGCYANKQDAINARKEAEEKYFKPILENYAQNNRHWNDG